MEVRRQLILITVVLSLASICPANESSSTDTSDQTGHIEIGPNPNGTSDTSDTSGQKGKIEVGPFRSKPADSVVTHMKARGIAFFVKFVPDPDTPLVVSGEMNIYNSNGLLVQSTSNDRLFGEHNSRMLEDRDTMQILFHWNGENDDGEEQPGGTYDYILKLTMNGRQETLEGKLYLPGEENPSERFGDCGAGMHLALLPLSVLGARRFRKKRRDHQRTRDRG